MVTDNNSKIDIIKLYPIPTQDSEEPKVLDSKALLASLKIDPGDLATTRLVRNQLESLQRYGLAKENSSGWMWIK